MSLPEDRDRKVVHASAAGWLRRHTTELASEITESYLARRPEFEDRFGGKARIRCQEDAAFHLHFLAEALIADSVQAFIDYTRWSKVMLAARKIPAEDLLEYLKHIRTLVLEKARYEERELIKFFLDAAIADLPQAPSAVPTFITGNDQFAKLANKVLQKLLVLDRRSAIDMVMNAVEEDLSIADLFHHVISPLQREVGRLWQENQITVVQEHYCTAAIESMLARLRRRFMGTPRQVKAVAFCAAGEQHCLGAQMFAELLEADGWEVIYLGANVPTRDLLLLLRKIAPDVVAMSVTTAIGLTGTRELINAIRELPQAPRILVGGFAVANNKTVATSLGADEYSASLTEGLDIANEWVKQGSAD